MATGGGGGWNQGPGGNIYPPHLPLLLSKPSAPFHLCVSLGRSNLDLPSNLQSLGLSGSQGAEHFCTRLLFPPHYKKKSYCKAYTRIQSHVDLAQPQRYREWFCTATSPEPGNPETIRLNISSPRRRSVCERQPDGRDGWPQHRSSPDEPGPGGGSAEPGGLEPDGEPAARWRWRTRRGSRHRARSLHHPDKLPRHRDTGRRRAGSAACRSDNDGQLSAATSWEWFCWFSRMGCQSTR